VTDIQLDTLEAKGLIKLATVRPDLEYLFRHALVQDAAYGSLLKQERRELHGKVGEALEQLYPDRRDELAPVLAMHFEQAGDNDKAINYLIAGGRHAIEANAIREAFAA
jgi:predicted ATPase